MEIDPRRLAPVDRYKLLIGGIVPRPIALVSTLDGLGRANLAPFSFFAGVGSDPMTLLFCPANKADGSEKDSLRNAKPVSEGGLGEFVVSTVPERIATRMAACAEPLPFGESEFEYAGLTMAASVVVGPGRVAESPMSFECRTLGVIRTNPGVASAGNIVLGEVVHVHADDGVLSDRFHADFAKLASIGRMGGTGYCRTRERFEMPVGDAARRIADPFAS
jgi:flavin reductase (DIM6/NTAB) family NADH-FMN oxidoreductase RutF